MKRSRDVGKSLWVCISAFSLLYCDAFGVNDCVSEGVCFHPTPLKMLCIIVLVITVFCRFNQWYSPQIAGYRDLNTLSWDMFVHSAKLHTNQHVSLINNAITLGKESFSRGVWTTVHSCSSMQQLYCSL